MKIFRYITALALSAMMAGCASDGFDSPGKGTDGMTEVTLRLPSPEGASNFARTRGEDPAPNSPSTSEEGKIVDGDLWLFAFPTSGSEENTLRTKLNPSDISMTNEYRDFKVKLIPDGYHFYVIANLKRFAGNQDFSSISEEALRALVLNFDGNGQELSTAKGLPMACLNTEIDEASEGVVDCSDGVAKTIHADLTFMCAKVRYTLLFDATDDGFSNAAFGSNTLDFSGVKTGNLVKQTKWVSPAAPASASDLFGSEGSIGKCSYPNPGLLGQYLSSTISRTGDAAPENLAAVTTHPSATQRAWQGVVYLPENLSEEDATRTTLTFTGSINGSSETEYTLPLVPAKAGTDGNLSPMERGHFYDLVGRITTSDLLSLTVRVADWTTQTLTYSLHGPYELIVEDTKLKVEAGKESRLWYHSDTEVTGESPKYNLNGKEIDFYDITTRNDSVIVSVNPEIPYAKISDKEKYAYFHVKAANLYKRIEVTPLILDPFLNVSPKDITIDLREYIGSGKYGGKIDIQFATNMDRVVISKGEGFPDNAMFSISGINGTTETFGSDGKLTTELNKGTNTLTFSGMEQGDDFWKSKRDFSLTYEAVSEDGSTKEETVNIHIIPYLLDYVIHFKADGWTSPHIYVYQCLELPADLTGTNAQYAGRTVGYSVSNSGIEEAFAALEYSFTGKIAFKGWEGYGGPFNSADYERNNPNYDGGLFNGFFIFKGHRTNDKSNWKAQYDWNDFGSNQDSKYDEAVYKQVGARYYRDLDFCEKHRNEISSLCGRCNSANYAKVWPGILMKKETGENDGWWRFDLTGVATPGKALIMFADVDANHAERKIGNQSIRFPAHEQVGLPLFDYPDREGWFEYNNNIDDRENNNFVDNKPNSNHASDLKTYRIYWYYGDDKGRDWIHILINGTKKYESNQGYEIAPNGNNCYYYDLKLGDNTDAQAWAYNHNSNSEYYPDNGKWVKANRTSDSDGRPYDYYVILY